MSNRTTIAQFARLDCVLFSQLCCSLFKLYGALAAGSKRAWSVEETLNYQQEQKGKQFEPILIDLLEQQLAQILEIKARWAE
jgi:response regulator RpfG family c-di-GMP phosphodiesterase